MEELCRTYWYPVYAFVRRQGHDLSDAQDLTQGFLRTFWSKTCSPWRSATRAGASIDPADPYLAGGELLNRSKATGCVCVAGRKAIKRLNLCGSLRLCVLCDNLVHEGTTRKVRLSAMGNAR